MANQNRSIGRFHLSDIPPAPRGVPQIEVTFDIDANGILHVSAKDKGTGKEQKIRIEASSGLSDAEIEKMKREAEANAEADKKAKEEIEKMNMADSLIFQTEKQIKDYGDKIPADKKVAIESGLESLKKAHAEKDLPAIETAMETLNAAWQAASQDIYNAEQAAQSNPNANAGPDNNEAGNVQDVDFEEVK
jgi:molecular chaperone DnaK